MRHQKRKYNVGTNPSHRKAILQQMAIALIEHGKIKTTATRCKALRSYVEKLVTIAKEDGVHHRRLVFSKLNNRMAVQKLFNDVAPKHKSRPGGYTRIQKLADTRVGDGASVAYISFVE